MKHLLGTAAALTLTAGAAAAGGMADPAPTPIVTAPVVVTPPPAPAADWSGFYGGLSYGVGSAEFGDGDDPFEYDTSGFGGQVGYLFDFGRIVAGAEVQYFAGEYELVDSDTAFDAGLTRAKAIVGYDAGRFMPYAFVGASMLDIDDLDESYNGYNYGVGAEYMVSNRFSIGAEYGRDEFDDEELSSDLVSIRANFRF
ncbi:outer membrane protein [Wenxinia marina]|uniref:Opacity protein n=1 Tax=Wenxinia marina DSM 24838 TaxID=1123501 RepID=A0A0D0Q9E4_9RHOB|nr:porin [Wenxinia marina]KIQ67663.1 Opacity protein [Wenxinia marina DSM 24838]GGL79898.1 membrane protein [Wenxinia marina]